VVLLALALMAAACTSGSPPPGMAATAPVRPSGGCSLPASPELTLAKQTLDVDGAARWYLISTPPPATAVRPEALVLDFHGLDEGAGLEALTTQFGPLAQKDRFMAAFPEGTGVPVGWNTSTGAASNPDLAFVSQLLDHLEATRCVDESRIYATGLSDGAFMTSLLACAMANRIAAFAPVSGVQLDTPCAATRAVPMLVFHGTADPILYFNGGLGTAVLGHALGDTSGPAPSIKVPAAKLNGPGYPATVAAWAKRDGCGARAVDTKVSPHVILRTYPCPSGTAVEFYIVLGGGHAWPSSGFSKMIAAVTGPTTFEINATTTIWKFFQRFQLR